MDWGDTPAWVACALSAGAFIVSLKARGDGKESARAAVRSANAAEAALAEQRLAAEEQRAADAEAARPQPELVVEYSRGSMYRLCNYGTGPALKVTVLEQDLPPVVRNRPIDRDLQPDEAHEFIMTGTLGGPVPPQVYVTWDGQDSPVPLRVPPRP
ncbi:hypothetical protein ABT116_10410 [Streptomyces sp. NPDC002130]|uniref:hypothetical protein n=1 Tax=Streptomyces sp. NPDC002130 TaxID=3155568 RepID=UPI00331B74BA